MLNLILMEKLEVFVNVNVHVKDDGDEGDHRVLLIEAQYREWTVGPLN